MLAAVQMTACLTLLPEFHCPKSSECPRLQRFFEDSDIVPLAIKPLGSTVVMNL